MGRALRGKVRGSNREARTTNKPVGKKRAGRKSTPICYCVSCCTPSYIHTYIPTYIHKDIPLESSGPIESSGPRIQWQQRSISPMEKNI